MDVTGESPTTSTQQSPLIRNPFLSIITWIFRKIHRGIVLVDSILTRSISQLWLKWDIYGYMSAARKLYQLVSAIFRSNLKFCFDARWLFADEIMNRIDPDANTCLNMIVHGFSKTWLYVHLFEQERFNKI